MAITRINLKDHSHRDVTHMPMEEFDSASSENSNSSAKNNRENLWMCGASQASMITDGLEWCKDVMDESYFLSPFFEEKFELVEWIHCLVASDVSTIDHGVKFCNDEGYDVVPIQMIGVITNDKTNEPNKR